MRERCPKCGGELTYFNRGGELVFDCHYDQKDCLIKSLEQQLEEAKARAEDMKQRNTRLRQERVNYYNGSALEEVTAKYNGLLVSYDTLAQKPGRELRLEEEVKSYAARLHEETRKVYEARLERDEAQGKALELESERDAALAQVGAKAELISAIAFASAKKWKVPAQEFYEQFQPWAQNLCRHHIANNTSATAQQFVQRIKEETVWKAWDYLREGFEHLQTVDGYATIKGAIKFQLFSAAILGEKETRS